MSTISNNQDPHCHPYQRPVHKDAHTHFFWGLVLAVPLGLLIWYGFFKVILFMYLLMN